MSSAFNEHLADVSVVIPCYNSQETILRALDSVLRQSLLPRELIVVDDCSNDGTVKVLKDLVTSYKGPARILIEVNSVNRGASFTRNKGWDLSTCDFVAFLDSDDSWFHNKIEIQYDWMLRNEDCHFSGHKCSFDQKRDFDFADIVFTKISPWRILISNPYPTPSVMLRRDLPFRFDVSLKRLEDQLLWSEIALSKYGCYYCSTPLAFVHKASYGEDGLSKNILQMEIGELMMYNSLYKKKYISFFLFILFQIFSLCKFCRRLVLFSLRKIFA
jgi:glycosyltransferase involved in cell wall biosynthesis